jgi:hypothetical protein
MRNKELIKAARAVAVTKIRPSVHVAKEYHARNRMEMEHWIKRKNELRAKAIMRGKKYSDFILENDIVRPVKIPVPSKEKATKPKKLSKK